MTKRVENIISEIEASVIEFRRKMHRYPELGDQEFKTTELILSALKEEGIETERITPTGCVGIIHGTKLPADVSSKSSPRCVALRADIDALPMAENTGLEFSSENEGCMHACGHDIHTSVLLGAAKVLNRMRDKFSGSVKLIFQPAEETNGGAKPMINAGCMKNPDVDFVLGLHIEPKLPSGTVGIKYGKVHASSDMFEMTVHGVKTHGAHPEHGVDAIIAASNIVTALQTIVSRNVAPTDSAVVTVGTFNSGTAVNIVSDRAVLSGTIRTLTPETRDRVKERFISTAQNVAAAYGASAEVKMIEGYAALINNDDIMQIVENVITEEIGSSSIVHLAEPSLGVEDFAFYLHEAPGAFYFLGCGYPGKNNPVIHTSEFEADETCIAIGIRLQTSACLRLLGD